MARHKHQAKARMIRTYRGPVYGAKYNQAAHGGILEIATCRCGATRECNRNGNHMEMGPWRGREDDRP